MFVARMEGGGIGIEKGELSEVEDDHGLASGHDAAAAVAGNAPDNFSSGYLQAHQFGGTVGGAVQGVDILVDQDAGIEVPLHVLLLPDRLGVAAGLGFDQNRA